jgi:hypothetical protein
MVLDEAEPSVAFWSGVSNCLFERDKIFQLTTSVLPDTEESALVMVFAGTVTVETLVRVEWMVD